MKRRRGYRRSNESNKLSRKVSRARRFRVMWAVRTYISGFQTSSYARFNLKAPQIPVPCSKSLEICFHIIDNLEIIPKAPRIVPSRTRNRSSSLNRVLVRWFRIGSIDVMFMFNLFPIIPFLLHTRVHLLSERTKRGFKY